MYSGWCQECVTIYLGTMRQGWKNFAICKVFVLVLMMIWTLHYFGFVAWLDAALLTGHELRPWSLSHQNKTRGGIVILKAALHQHDGEYLMVSTYQFVKRFVIKRVTRRDFFSSAVFVYFFRMTRILHYFGFVAWLDTVLPMGHELWPWSLSHLK